MKDNIIIYAIYNRTQKKYIFEKTGEGRRFLIYGDKGSARRMCSNLKDDYRFRNSNDIIEPIKIDTKEIAEHYKNEINLQQRIDKAIEYATNEMRIVNDNEYHRLIEILRGKE